MVQKKCSGIDVSSERILMCPQRQVLGLEDFAIRPWPWPRTPGLEVFGSQILGLGLGLDNQVLDSNAAHDEESTKATVRSVDDALAHLRREQLRVDDQRRHEQRHYRHHVT